MKFFVLLLALCFASAAPAYAQQDYGDILEDIFGGSEFPFPTDPTDPNDDGTESQTISLIDNIPVEVNFRLNGLPLPGEAMLIVTAYAPPPPNVRRAAPLMLGQTRLLLTGLPAPLGLIIAAPSAVTKDLDYARIDAKIVDANGATLFNLKEAGEYRGVEAAKIFLTRFGDPAPLPGGIDTPSNIETITGRVSINGAPPSFNGSNLVVRLVENGLAGGIGDTIAGESRQSLDGLTAPYSFELARAIDEQRPSMPLAFEVWIEDWAGRKTHVMPRPVPFNAQTNIAFTLDAITSTPPECTVDNPCTNMPTIDGNPPETSVPQTTAPEKLITGEARFNAYKGLPLGSVMIASIERIDTLGRPVQIAQTRVPLDGKSGDITFYISAPATAFDPNQSIASLTVRIEDANGRLFFSSIGESIHSEGTRKIQLEPAPDY